MDANGPFLVKSATGGNGPVAGPFMATASDGGPASDGPTSDVAPSAPIEEDASGWPVTATGPVVDGAGGEVAPASAGD